MTAVASGHDDEPLDLSLLDLFDDRSREGENRIVGETDRNLLPFLGLQAFQLFGLGDDCGEIFPASLGPIADVGDSRPTDQTGCEDSILVVVQRLLNAVGRHHDGTVEFGELLLLVVPGRSVVSRKVGVLLEGWIGMGGEHLSMGVYLDPCPLCLFQNLFEIQQVVAAHQDGRSFVGPCKDLRDLRVAVLSGVPLVQEGHGLYCFVSGFQDQADQFVSADVVSQGGR